MYYIRKTIGRWLKSHLGLRTYPPQRYLQIFQEIDKMHPQTILEIGTNDGINAAHLCRHASRHRNDVQYFGFDLFEYMDDQTFLQEFTLTTPSREKVERYLKRQGIMRSQLYAGNTVSTLSDQKLKLPKTDLVFIDGGHSQETVAADWKNVQDMVHSGSVIFFDDYPNFGIGAVVDKIDRKRWDVRIMPIEDVYPVNRRFNKASECGIMSVKLARVAPISAGKR